MNEWIDFEIWTSATFLGVNWRRSPIRALGWNEEGWDRVWQRTHGRKSSFGAQVWWPFPEVVLIIEKLGITQRMIFPMTNWRSWTLHHDLFPLCPSLLKVSRRRFSLFSLHRSVLGHEPGRKIYWWWRLAANDIEFCVLRAAEGKVGDKLVISAQSSFSG